MRLHHRAAVTALVLALSSPIAVFAQPRPDQPDLTLTPAMRKQVVDGIVAAMHKTYVFPETAKQMERAIRKKSYDKVTSAKAFATELTADLRAVSKDKHIQVGYSHDPIPERKEGAKPSPEQVAMHHKRAAKWNYGFTKVERLPGNIGYIDLRHFESPALAGRAAESAFTFVAGTDALIIDMRENGGGEPAMVQLMVSYLLAADDEVLINSIYDRPKNQTQQFWNIQHLPGPRFAGKDVYVLTAKRTFSGAEEFAYDVQSLKRGKLIGETTGGGANPGDFIRIHEHFGVFVPSGRAINPVTKTNWEGVGVKPDESVPAARAFDVAYQQALEKALPNAIGPGLKREIEEALGKLKSRAQ
jgi:retinol-binding protein 3